MKIPQEGTSLRAKGEACADLFFKTTMVLLLLIFAALAGANAQQTVPASGGDASGSGGSVSYSVGQLFFMTYEGTSGSVSEGVQQPYEISVVTGIDKAEGIELRASAYPNPVSDYLILSIENDHFDNLEFRLFDVNGKLLSHGKITGREITIPMTGLISGNYFLKVIQTMPVPLDVKTFKIIKK